MSATQTFTTRRDPECAALAPLLALRETGALDAEEAARLDAHLATCATCQQDAALDDALASQLRQALSAPAAAPLRLANIIAAVEAPPSDATLPEAPPSRTPVRAVTTRWRPAPRWAGGLSAAAAAVAVIVLASYVFGGFGGRLGGNRRGVTPAPTLSPLLAQQTVYVPTGVGIYALRASDGAVRWVYPPDIRQAPMSDTRAIRGLALDGGTLYVLAAASGSLIEPDSTLLALGARTGATRWSVDIHGLAQASLLWASGLLIVTPVGADLIDAIPLDRTVLAFSAASGQRVWSRELTEPPLCASVAANGALFVATATRLIALDVAGGAVRWITPIVPSASQQGTTPAAENTTVALAAAGPYVFVLAKRGVGSGNAISWEANLYEITAADGRHIARDGFEHEPLEGVFAPTPGGSQVFASVFGGLSAFSTGVSPDMMWRFIPDGAADGGVVMTGAAYSDGVVYVTDLTGILASHNGARAWENDTYAARASDGAELWRAPTNGGLNAQAPVVASGVVFAPASASLVALRAADGQQLWRYILPGGGHISEPLLG